jgi:flagellar hook-associated protein 3 FlgL
MGAPYISTKAINEANRLTVTRLQRELVVAQKELSSGRLADVGQTLGARTTDTVSLRQDLNKINSIVDSNASVNGRVDVAQTALNNMASSTQTFINSLIGARDSVTGPQVAQNEGTANLVSLTSALNTTFGGAYIFAGENVDIQPVADYFASPTSPNRAAVANAFQSFFGFSQTDPQVASITPNQMQNFLDNGLAPIFEEPQWSATWSDASDRNVQSQISPFETAETSTNANEAAFRHLAKAFTMLSDLGVTRMSRETFRVVANEAIEVGGVAIQELAVEQARLGTTEGRIATVNTQMNAQADILTREVNNLEAVDPFEAGVRVTSLTTQIQTAYALTARVQQLTLLNYL